jgi:hypothetical protein
MFITCYVVTTRSLLYVVTETGMGTLLSNASLVLDLLFRLSVVTSQYARYFTKTQFNIRSVFPSMPTFPKRSLPSRCFAKFFIHFPFPSYLLRASPLHPPSFNNPDIVKWRVNITTFLVSFSLTCCYCPFLNSVSRHPVAHHVFIPVRY